MVLLLVPIAVILAAYVALAITRQSHSWADAIVHWIANFPIVGVALARVLGIMLLNGADWISNRLGSYYLGLEGRVINWLGALGHYADMSFHAFYDWPVELLSAVRWLVTSEIPSVVRALPNSLTGAFHDAVRWLRSLEQRVSRVVAHTPSLIRSLAAAVVTGALTPFLLPLHWLQKEWRTIAKAAAAAGGIAIPWIWVPRLRRDVINLRKELDKVKGLLGVSVLAVAIARVLRVTPKCLTSGNIGRISRKLCGLGPKALEDLLGLLADVLILQNICEVVKVMEDALGFVLPDVAAFIATAEQQFIHCGYDLPANGTVAAPDTPPVTGLTLSLA